MHYKAQLAITFLSLSAIAPKAIAKPVPFDLKEIFDEVKKGFKNLLENGLGDIAVEIEKDSKDILGGLLPGSPGKPLAPELLPDMQYMAEFASASYCDGTHVVGTQTQCKENFCPTLTANNVFTEANFANQKDTDTTGIVTRDDTTKSIVVAYRGSQSIRNWFSNIRVGFVPVPEWCSGCEAHSGFLDSFKDEKGVVIDSVTKLKTSHPDYQLAVVGHSLGGAVATLAATEFRKLGFELSLFTYGAPRVGNEALSRFISDSGANFRVTHLNDPVPRLPPLALGYRHIEPEYHIFRGDSPIKAEDVKVFSGLVNFEGNTGFGGLVSFNTSAHRQYLLSAKFSGCDDSTREGVEFRI